MNGKTTRPREAGNPAPRAERVEAQGQGAREAGPHARLGARLAAGALAPAEVLRLQRTLGNRAVGRLLQRAPLAVRQTTFGWNITGRPSFMSHVIGRLVEKHNELHDTDFDPREISLTDEELDQCHVIAWADIRGMVIDLVNGDMPPDEFVRRTTALYGADDSSFALNEWAAMSEVQDRVVAGVRGTKPLKGDDIYELCRRLNSATPNLRLDDKWVNRKIRDHVDPHLVATPSGQHWSSTPNTYANLSENFDQSRGLLWSPHGSHFYSSSTGPVSPSSMTPNTSAVMDLDKP